MPTTITIKWMFIATAALLILPFLAAAQQSESHIGKFTGRSESGKQLFYRFCWGCHGFRGDGNGENWLPTGSFPYEPYLNIQPRNFVAATFKCRSTPTGTLPTDQDLYNSLVRGLNRSPAIRSRFHRKRSSRLKASSMGRNSSRNWNAGSATVKKASATAHRLQRSPTATTSQFGPITLPWVRASSVERPIRTSTRFL